MILKVFDNIGKLAETVVCGSLRGVAALIGNGDFIITVTLFGGADTGDICVDDSFNICGENCAALVKHAVKVNPSVFERSDNFLRAGVIGADNLLIMAEAEINIALGHKSLLHKGFDGFKDADHMVFHINGASAPDIFTVVMSAERVIFPVILGTGGDRHNILMREQSHRLKVGVFTLPFINKAGF